MIIHLHNEIERLKKQILKMGTLVEENVAGAVRAIEEKDGKLAQQIIDRDDVIDLLEVEIEEDCLKILALYQPVAIDLRYIISILKINNDLERIADLAENIAERARNISTINDLTIPFDFTGMAGRARHMLKNSLDALVDKDTKLAREVCAMDDEVDQINRDVYSLIESNICENSSRVGLLLQLITVSRNLERIADHATNIAEDVIYMVEGIIYRHFGDGEHS